MNTPSSRMTIRANSVTVQLQVQPGSFVGIKGTTHNLSAPDSPFKLTIPDNLIPLSPGDAVIVQIGLVYVGVEAEPPEDILSLLPPVQ